MSFRKHRKFWQAVYPPRMAPIGVKLWENAFQTILQKWSSEAKNFSGGCFLEIFEKYADHHDGRPSWRSTIMMVDDHDGRPSWWSTIVTVGDHDGWPSWWAIGRPSWWSMIFGRTELRISASRAKNREQSDFEVQKCVAPQNPDKNIEKRNFETEKFAKIIFRRRKMKCCKSSETRFGKVWGRTELCLRGKRPFEISMDPNMFRTNVFRTCSDRTLFSVI